MHLQKTLAASVVTLTLAAASALADPMNPTYDTFANLAGATYGGSGIPTDPSAIRTITDGATTITLGMIAHQRFNNPPLTNDGAGTFFAGNGANNGTPGQPGTAATWNFGFYVNIAGPNNASDYQFTLLYDLDPGKDTDDSAAGKIDLNAAVFALGGGLVWDTAQDSQNAAFAFLCGAPILPYVTAPGSCPFNPYEAGEYSFALVASTTGGVEMGRAGINVEVVPEPASLALLGLGLAGLGFSRRRKS